MNNTPFSIVIPTYNRNTTLSTLITRLKAERYDGQWEVIVADNSPGGSAKDIVAKATSRFFRPRYVHEPRSGPSLARNAGTNLARYRVIIYIDDDVIVSPGVLGRFDHAVRQYPHAAAIGARIEAIPGSPLTRSQLWMWDIVRKTMPWVVGQTDMGNAAFIVRSEDTLFSSACVAVNTKLVPRPVFNDRFGRRYGSRVLYGEDIELGLRCLSCGYPLVYYPQVTATNVFDPMRLTVSFAAEKVFYAGVERAMMNAANSRAVFRPGGYLRSECRGWWRGRYALAKATAAAVYVAGYFAVTRGLYTPRSVDVGNSVKK